MLLMVTMLLTACSDHSGEGSDEKGDCFLNIYVYAPEHPMLTRADVGTIASRTAKEHMVHTLQIWVFNHRDGSLVGYLEAEPTFLNETDGQEMFQMKVKKEFADHPENVDVYVVANAFIDFTNRVKNYDLIYINDKNEVKELTLDKNTERTKLEKAMIGEGSFGVKQKEETENVLYIPAVSSVPVAGLPMSGVLKNQPIYGSYPTLRVGTQDAMATLQLTRAVSKLRFVLCQKKEKDNAKKKLVSIGKIELNGSVIPTASYLMPVEKPSYTSVGYVSTPIDYGSIEEENIGVIPSVKNPMVYAYETQSAQEYEDLINHAADGDESRKAENIAWLNGYGARNNVPELKVENFTGAILQTNSLSWPQLMELGPTYFRESDKKLTGTITYTVQEREKNGEEWTDWKTEHKTADFSMADPGDFLRNHSWIVYVFYMDATIYTLTVTNIGMKSWASGGYEEKSVYNW